MAPAYQSPPCRLGMPRELQGHYANTELICEFGFYQPPNNFEFFLQKRA